MSGAVWSNVLVAVGLLWTSLGCAVHSSESHGASDVSSASEIHGASDVHGAGGVHGAGDAQSLRGSRSSPATPLTTSRRAPILLAPHSVTLSLPERELWQVNEVGSYSRAYHAETSGELWVKRWSEGERVNSAACARQSQLWRPRLAAPSMPPSRQLERTIATDYHVEIQLHQWADDGSWHGRLTAHGAAIRDCLSYVYFTHAADSPLGRAVVVQRMDVMLEVLEDLNVQSTASNLP
jgi:hypothetical protein